MDKKKLLAIPLSKSKRIADEMHYRCARQVTQIDGTEVTVYTVWKKEKEVYFRTFCWEGQFCTWVHDYKDPNPRYIPACQKQNRWSNAMIDKFIYRGCEWSIAHGKEKPFRRVDGNRTAEQLYKFQAGIRNKALVKKQKALKQTTEMMMAQLKPLPKDIDRFLIDRVFLDSRYIYYQTDSTRKVKGKAVKTLDGFCTHCRANVIFETQKPGSLHNEPGRCPACHSAITYKNKGVVSQYMKDDQRFVIMQRTKTGAVIRGFWARREYGDHPCNPKNTYHEKFRIFMDATGQLTFFEWDYMQERATGKYSYQWRRYGEGGIMHPTNGVLYTKNLRYVLAGTPWQYSGLDLFAKAGYLVAAEEYLAKYTKCPSIEYMVKLGLYHAVAEHLPQGYFTSMGNYHKETTPIVNGAVVNLYMNSLKDVLPNTDKRDLPMLKQLDPSVKMMEFVAQMRIREKPVTVQDVRWVLSFGGEAALFHFKRASVYCPTKRIREYMDQQYKKLGLVGQKPEVIRKRKDLLGDWCDYLSMLKVMQRDITNRQLLYPQSVKEAHDQATEHMKTHEKELQDNAIAKMVPEYRARYTFEHKGIMIAVPECADDITKEGKALGHCVANYLDSVVKQKTVILFLRRTSAPQESFYTMEVREGIVSQCRGKRNADMTKEVEKFVKEFERKILKIRIEVAC